MLLDVRKVMASHFMDITTGLAGSFSLTLLWPPSVNHIWRRASGKVYVDPKAMEYRNDVIDRVRYLRASNLIPSKPFECDCAVMIEYCPPHKRRIDIDNYFKVIFDAFTHAGVWKDDSQVKLLLSFFGRTVKGGAVKVLIQPLEV